MIRRPLVFLSLMAVLAAVPAAPQFDTSTWNLPFEPFAVAGPVSTTSAPASWPHTSS